MRSSKKTKKKRKLDFDVGGRTSDRLGVT